MSQQSIAAIFFGTLGVAPINRYYWVVPNFPNDQHGDPIGPAVALSSAYLDNNNRVLVKWDVVPCVSNYTILQTDDETPPASGPIGVAPTVTANSYTDDGSPHFDYPPAKETGAATMADSPLKAKLEEEGKQKSEEGKELEAKQEEHDKKRPSPEKHLEADKKTGGTPPPPQAGQQQPPSDTMSPEQRAKLEHRDPRFKHEHEKK